MSIDKKKRERSAKIERCMRLTWDSLQSHLVFTYSPITKKEKKDGETNDFHKRCVREYAEVISILADLL